MNRYLEIGAYFGIALLSSY